MTSKSTNMHGWLVCQQDKTKTTEQIFMKPKQRMALLPE